MSIQTYGKITDSKHKKAKKRIIGLIIIVLIILAAVSIIGVLAGNSSEYSERVSILEENHMLKERIAELESETEQLKAQISEKDAYISSIPTSQPEPYEPQSTDEAQPEQTPLPLSPRAGIE